MSDTMLKRVARALSEAGCAADWDNALEGARAAIKEMRDYTEPMSTAGYDAASTHADSWKRTVNQADLEISYIAMIDEALASPL